MTPISIDQWNAFRQQGYTDAVIAQSYTLAPAPAAPQLPQIPQQPPAGGYAPQAPGWGAPQATRAGVIGSVLSTPIGNRSGQYFGDDDGKYDGNYVADVSAARLIDVDGGQAFVLQVVIVEGDNPALTVGSERDIYHNLNRREGKQDAHETWALLAAALGRPLDEATVAAFTSEAQICKGLRLHINVDTRPQKKDRTKSWSHVRLRALAAGASLGLRSAGGAAPSLPAMPQGMAPAAPPPALPPPPAMPPAMPPPMAPPAPGYPPVMPPALPPPGYPPAAAAPLPPPPGSPPPGYPPGYAYPPPVTR